MGPFPLVKETGADIDRAVEAAVRDALRESGGGPRPDDDLCDEIADGLLQDRGRLVAVVEPLIDQLDRIRRAQQRLDHVPRQAWLLGKAREASQWPDRWRGSGHADGAGGDAGEKGDGGATGPGTATVHTLYANLDRYVDTTVLPDLRDRLGQRVVAPEVRRRLHRDLQSHAAPGTLYADDVDLPRLHAAKHVHRAVIDTGSLKVVGQAVGSRDAGSVGLAGGRQVGKTTALRTRTHPFQVDLRAPTEYVPHEFLLRLADEIAAAWLRRDPSPKDEIGFVGARLRRVAMTASGVLAGLLMALGLWLTGSYVVRTELAQPGESVAVVVALAAVLSAAFLGRWAGERLFWLNYIWDVSAARTRNDQRRPELLPGYLVTTWAGTVGLLTGMAMVALSAVVLLLDAYPYAGVLTRAELAATLMSSVALVAVVGAYVARDLEVRHETPPLVTAVAVIAQAAAMAVLWPGVAFLVLPDFDLSAGMVVGTVIVASAVCALTIRKGIRKVDPKGEPTPADRMAEDLRVRLAYERSRATDTSAGVTVDLSRILPVEATHEVKQSVTETERALTVSQTVKLIRELLAEIHEELSEGSDRDTSTVLITIDDVDKLEASDTACEFINELKAVFGVPGVVFLVAVSEDARASHERRGLAFRDAFDSAFDEVVHLQPFTFAETEELLVSGLDLERGATGAEGPAPGSDDEGRGEPTSAPLVLPRTYAAVAHCLAGGLAGDVQRVFDHMTEENAPHDLAAAAAAAIHRELRSTWKATISALRLLRLEPHVSELILAMHDIEPCPESGEVEQDCFLRTDPLTEITQLRLSPPRPGQEAEHQTLQRLVGEYVGFVYLCRTLMDFLDCDDDVRITRMETATRSSHEKASLDYLTRARNQLAATPRLGWQAISYFRREHGMGEPPGYPYGLLGLPAPGPTSPVVPDTPAGITDMPPKPKMR